MFAPRLWLAAILLLAAAPPVAAFTFHFTGAPGAADAGGLNYFGGWFDAEDGNGDGFVTTEEVTAYRASLQGGTPGGPSAYGFAADSQWAGSAFSVRYQLYSGIAERLAFSHQASYPCKSYPGAATADATRSFQGFASSAGGSTSWGISGLRDADGDSALCASYDGSIGTFRFENLIQVTGEPAGLSASMPLPTGLPLLLTGMLLLAAGPSLRTLPLAARIRR